MSVIKIANLSSNVEYFQERILELVEEVSAGRLTQKQTKALKAIKHFASSSLEDTLKINEKACALVESALKGGK